MMAVKHEGLLELLRMVEENEGSSVLSVYEDMESIIEDNRYEVNYSIEGSEEYLQFIHKNDVLFRSAEDAYGSVFGFTPRLLLQKVEKEDGFDTLLDKTEMRSILSDCRDGLGDLSDYIVERYFEKVIGSDSKSIDDILLNLKYCITFSSGKGDNVNYYWPGEVIQAPVYETSEAEDQKDLFRNWNDYQDGMTADADHRFEANVSQLYRIVWIIDGGREISVWYEKGARVTPPNDINRSVVSDWGGYKEGMTASRADSFRISLRKNSSVMFTRPIDRKSGAVPGGIFHDCGTRMYAFNGVMECPKCKSIGVRKDFPPHSYLLSSDHSLDKPYLNEGS